MTDSDAAARRAVEFLEAIGNTPDLDSDVRRWSNTGMRWAWLAGYLAAIEDQATGTPSGTPFPARSHEEEDVPEPPAPPQVRRSIQLLQEQFAKAQAKGYTAEHDQEHGPQPLVFAGLAYATNASAGVVIPSFVEPSYQPYYGYGQWPFDVLTWRPDRDPAVTLAKAAQLLLAAIDALGPVDPAPTS